MAGPDTSTNVCAVLEEGSKSSREPARRSHAWTGACWRAAPFLHRHRMGGGANRSRESCLGSAEDLVSTGESKLSFGGAACTRNAPCPHRASLGRRPWTKRQQASTGKPPMRMDATGQSNNGARRSNGTTCIWTARIASIIKMIGIVCRTHILAYNPRRRCLDGGTDRTDALTYLARCQHLPFLPIRHVKRLHFIRR